MSFLNSSENRLVSVIEALSANFEAVFEVDADSDKITEVRVTPEYDDRVSRYVDSGRYSERVAYGIENNVAEEDRAMVAEKFDAENVWRALADEPSCFCNYRIKTPDGNTQYCRAKFVRSGPADSLSRVFIVAISNSDAEMRRSLKDRESREMRSRLINILAGDYTGLFCFKIDDLKGNASALSESLSPDMLKGFDSSLSLRDGFLNYLGEFVHPDDRHLLEGLLDPDSLAKLLAHTKRHVILYRSNFKGEYAYCRLTAAKMEDVHEPPVNIVLGFSLVDSSYSERLQQEAVIKGLGNDFDCIAYVDLDNGGKCTFHRISPAFGNHIPGWENGLSYETVINEICATSVAPEDRERFLTETNRLSITEQLRSKPAVFCNFKTVRSAGNIRYCQVKYTAAGGEMKGFIAGFHDVDDEIRRELSREEELAQANERAERTIVRRTMELRERNRALARTNDEIVELLGGVVEMRDRESGEHVRRVKAFSCLLAKEVMKQLPEYGLTEELVGYITSASALHDMGKIMIPDAILQKPGKLTPEEFEVMKTHSERGRELVDMVCSNWSAKYTDICRDICLYHHEKWDGSGYPTGRKGDDIPISAQIVSIADCFDALTTKRVYKDAYPSQQAFDMIKNGECGAFSDKLLACLEACRSDFFDAADHPDNFVFDAGESNYSTDKLNGLKILLVDDNQFNLEMNMDILKSEGAQVSAVSGGRECLDEFAAAGPFDAVLMDIIMPDMDGIETTKQLRRIEAAAGHVDRVPIIALTSDATEAVKNSVVSAGANACMSKPLMVAELTRIMLACMRERSRSMEQRIAATLRIANTDALTKVKNITAYTDMVAGLSEELSGSKLPEFAIVMCDINKLKSVNDTFGHETGDTYIKNCCRIICQVYDHSPVYRIGGDEFVVLLRGSDYANRDSLLKELENRVSRARELPTYDEGKASFAAGMAVFNPVEDYSVSEVVERADKSMYSNKRRLREMTGEEGK